MGNVDQVTVQTLLKGIKMKYLHEPYKWNVKTVKKTENMCIIFQWMKFIERTPHR